MRRISTLSHHRFDASVVGQDVLIEHTDASIDFVQDLARQGGQARIVERHTDVVSKVESPLRHDDAELGQQAAHLIDQSTRDCTSSARTRCTTSIACCSALLIGTKRMFGRPTASQIASASLLSFFWFLR